MSKFSERISGWYSRVAGSVADFIMGTNSKLKESFEVWATKISENQLNSLKKSGENIKPIGSKLVVVSNNTECKLFKLTEENGIVEIDFKKAVGFAPKNISRVFRELFTIEGKDGFKVVEFNPDTNTIWKVYEYVFKEYKSCKDPLDRSIKWVTFYTDKGRSTTVFPYEYGWHVTEFKLDVK